MATQEEINEYIEGMENEMQELNKQKRQLSKAQLSLFGTPDDDNLIKWQLDLREDLDRIYHLLKGDIVKEDEKGNIHYIEPDDEDLKPFNEFGVQLLMNIMSFYLNRNTILSNYDEDTINWKVKDFGYEITDLIFIRYEEMGMDTLDKRKMYPMIVRELVDSVHSAYLRALNGGERDSLRTARMVTQTDNMRVMQQYPTVSQPKPSKLNPLNWFRT